MNKTLLLILLLSSSNFSIYAQTAVYVHQSCHQRTVGVINHPEIEGKKVDNETILFNIPTGEEPIRISFYIDTAGFKVERIWIDSSTKKVDLWVYNCKAYQSRIENPNNLTSEERANNLYFDYLAQKFTDKVKYTQAFNDFLSQYIREHPESYLSLNYLTKFTGTDVEIAELLKILESKNKTYGAFQKMKNRLLYKGKVTLGERLPEFTAVQLNGENFATNDLSGKATVLMFWQSGCKWSRKVLPAMHDLQQKFSGQGVGFVYFSLDENKALWQETSIANQIGDWNISDLQGVYSKTALEMGITSTPYFFVLDGEGKVRLCTFGDEVGLLETELKRVLNKR